MRTRIKICGITRVEDALLAAGLGVDALGLVFVPRSKRALALEQARAIVRAVPPFVTTVGLFLDAGEEEIRAVLREVPLDLLQFHGDECPADCGGYGRPYIKAVSMAPGVDVEAYAASYPDAAGFILDSHAAGGLGGTGGTFDWSRFPHAARRPMILAGGLNAQNVAEAVLATRPYGVDVSSGVEREPGIKDHDKMKVFVEEVRRVDSK